MVHHVEGVEERLDGTDLLSNDGSDQDDILPEALEPEAPWSCSIGDVTREWQDDLETTSTRETDYRPPRTEDTFRRRIHRQCGLPGPEEEEACWAEDESKVGGSVSVYEVTVEAYAQRTWNDDGLLDGNPWENE